MLSTAAAIIMQTKSYEISAMSINTVVKLKVTRLSVYLLNAPLIWRQMTSALCRFFLSHDSLYCAALYQNRDAVFIWSVDK